MSTASADHHKGGKKDIFDTAVSAGSFKTPAAALGAAHLVETMK
ncbi:MAG: fasciclin domain-containing protein, partial [Verrucomicrobiaceae bacterium]|nr:fasciclin domain-containing protein [Verrucomicrobiaceae bacterium]